MILRTATVGDFTYSYNPAARSEGVTVTGFVGAGTTAAIPASVQIGGNPYAVQTIGADGLASSGLTAVTIPATVMEIQSVAFATNALTSIFLPASVTTIGEQAFLGNSLSTLFLPDTVTSVGDFAFSGNRLTQLRLPMNLETIANGAFFQNLLTDIALPATVKAIGDQAFSDNALTSIVIPEGVTSIGINAFSDNPLDSVLMQGPAPATIGTSPFGDATATTPLVSYYERFAASGYTAPTWTVGGQVYASRSLWTVTLDGDPGAVPTTVDLVLGDDLPDPGHPPVDGSRFLGWYAAAAGGAALTFPLAVTGDTELYAQWQKRAVAFHAAVTLGQPFDLAGEGFEPGETVLVYLHSDPVLIGAVIASSDGTIVGRFSVPTDTVAGAHELALTGSLSGVTRYAIAVSAPTIPPVVTDPPTPTLTDPPVVTDEDGTIPSVSSGPDSLAHTGADGFETPTVAALVILLTGLGMVVAARARRRPTGRRVRANAGRNRDESAA